MAFLPLLEEVVRSGGRSPGLLASWASTASRWRTTRSTPRPTWTSSPLSSSTPTVLGQVKNAAQLLKTGAVTEVSINSDQVLTLMRLVDRRVLPGARADARRQLRQGPLRAADHRAARPRRAVAGRLLQAAWPFPARGSLGLRGPAMAGVIDTSEFRKGMKIEVDGEPFEIIEFQHVKPGKGSAFVRTSIKSLLSGRVLQPTFKSGDKVGKPDIEEKADAVPLQAGRRLLLHGHQELRADVPGREGPRRVAATSSRRTSTPRCSSTTARPSACRCPTRWT